MSKYSPGPFASRALLLVTLALLGFGAVGCWDGNPCDPGQIIAQDVCISLPALTDASDSDGQIDADASDAQALTDATDGGAEQ